MIRNVMGRLLLPDDIERRNGRAIKNLMKLQPPNSFTGTDCYDDGRNHVLFCLGNRE